MLGITDSRPENGTTRRRRRCIACEHRFTTIEMSYEALDRLPLVRQIEALGAADQTFVRELIERLARVA